MQRIGKAELKNKVKTADEAAMMIKDGMIVGTSGFTVVGYPKAVPAAMARRVENGEKLGITLIVGGNVGDELDGVLARAGILGRRYGFQNNASVRELVNQDKIKYVDTHVSHVPFLIKNGYLGKIDVAIIEVAAIDEQCNLIPGLSVAVSDVLVQCADKIIIEVNESIPLGVAGMHDIYTPARMPNTQPIPLTRVSDRIGVPYIPCDPDKIAAVVMTNQDNTNSNLMEPNEEMEAIASHLVTFFKEEIRAGRLPDPLPPMQSGVGGVSNAVLLGLEKSDIENLTIYTEVMQDAVLQLIDCGKVVMASGTALTISPDKRDSLYATLDRYRDKIILRPQEISNSPEVIRRLGVIAMNTALEADLSGNVNSTHVNGGGIINGLGGSGDYTRNAGLSIFTTVSTAKNGTISCIVPHVFHVDHTEHDTQILVTEQGLADLRGMTAYERAHLIIEKCAHPKYRSWLRKYAEEAYEKSPAKHSIIRLPE